MVAIGMARRSHGGKWLATLYYHSTMTSRRPLWSGLAERCIALLLGLSLAAYPLAGMPLTSALPTLGDSSSDDLSPVTERKLGEEIMREARKAGDIFEDAPSTEYLNQFGANLVAHAPIGTQPIEFFLVLDPNINAFALPGGFIGVNSGLIVATQSESELASVMSHEMGHVIQRHIAREIGHEKQTSILALAGIILGALAMAKASAPDAGEAAIMMSQNYALHSELAFSRDAEREADRVGFQILGESGFDPSGMATFFQRLEVATRIYENGAPEWMHDHPMTTERIADIQGRIRSADVRQRPDSLDFNLTRARLRVMQDRSVKGLNETRAAFEDQLKRGSYANELAIHYGLAVDHLQQSNLAAAQSEVAKVRALARQPDFMIESLAIDLELARKDFPTAVRVAHAALGQFPASRSLAYRYAEALQENGQNVEAVAFLRDQLEQYRSEPPLYQLIAKSYAGQNKVLLEHQALAEEYYLKGSVQEAIEQLNIARRANDGDFYAQSEIDARLRDLKVEWADLQKERKENGKSRATGVSVTSGKNSTRSPSSGLPDAAGRKTGGLPNPDESE